MVHRTEAIVIIVIAMLTSLTLFVLWCCVAACFDVLCCVVLRCVVMCCDVDQLDLVCIVVFPAELHTSASCNLVTNQISKYQNIRN